MLLDTADFKLSLKIELNVMITLFLYFSEMEFIGYWRCQIFGRDKWKKGQMWENLETYLCLSVLKFVMIRNVKTVII